MRLARKTLQKSRGLVLLEKRSELVLQLEQYWLLAADKAFIEGCVLREECGDSSTQTAILPTLLLVGLVAAVGILRPPPSVQPVWVSSGAGDRQGDKCAV